MRVRVRRRRIEAAASLVISSAVACGLGLVSLAPDDAPSAPRGRVQEPHLAVAPPAVDPRGDAPVPLSATTPQGPAAPAATQPASVKGFLRSLESLRPDDARARVREALDTCGDPAERALLVAAERRLRLRASPLALADARPPRVAELEEALGPIALPEHARLLEDASRPAEVRAAAARALSTAGGPRATELLLRALVSSDPTSRALAAEALGARPDLTPDAEGTLVRVLDDPAPVVRAAAARGLGARGRAADALVRVAAREPESMVLAVCLEALGGGADPAHLELLRAHASAGAPEVRAAALRALARSGLGSDEQEQPR